MIEIEDLSFRYNQEQEMVLDKLNLRIFPGQWVSIIGANGSGKSTLARHLNALLLPTSGKVRVDGLDSRQEYNLPAIRQKVSFVFQNPDNQIVGVSVEDDIAFGPENLGLEASEIDQRIEEALKITELCQLRHKEPHFLSGGEKQRLAIAGALAMSSRYLVLDEPTSMLDPLMRQQVIRTLQHLHQELQLTIIYVTNIMEEALLAERVVVLGQGQVVLEGAPAEVFSAGERLQAYGLGVPPLCRLADRLADAGRESLRGATSVEHFMEDLCT
ncbi:MAG: energy-coupling factor transporter ATPase [Bacillota bacterium]